MALLGLCGCAPTVEPVAIERLDKRIAELQRQAARRNERLQELSNRMFTLSSRLDAVQTKLHEQRNKPLRVVRLSPPEQEGTSSRAAPKTQTSSAKAEASAEQTAAAIDITMDDGNLRAPAPSRQVAAAQPQRSQKRARRRQAALALFERGLQAFRNGETDAARKYFERFMSRHEKHPRVAHAHYWRGECLFEQSDYLEAVDAYQQVVERFPGSAKAPHALLKIGLAYENLGRLPNARRSFERLLREHPSTPLAELARARLAHASKAGAP